MCVDGCIVKAPCGGEAAGKSPVDRGKQGTKRSVLVDGSGIPLGCVAAPANCHDSPLLRPTLERLGRFADHLGLGIGVGLPEQIAVHLDAGHDSGKTRDLIDELGCQAVISPKDTLQAGRRWPVERTNSWHNRGFKKLLICTERRTRVIDAFIALANPAAAPDRLGQLPLGHPPQPTTMITCHLSAEPLRPVGEYLRQMRLKPTHLMRPRLSVKCERIELRDGAKVVGKLVACRHGRAVNQHGQDEAPGS